MQNERREMTETKYGRFIITEPKPNIWDMEEGNVKDGPDVMTPVVYLDNKVLNGAFYVESSWFWKANKFSPPAHTHDFDEVLAFFGSNPKDPHDLCGEVELWLEDERHILTKSCLVFIPKGMKHCPMLILRADRPIFHFAAGNTNRYVKEKK
jgi:hypothetical protein